MGTVKTAPIDLFLTAGRDRFISVYWKQYAPISQLKRGNLHDNNTDRANACRGLASRRDERGTDTLVLGLVLARL